MFDGTHCSCKTWIRFRDRSLRRPTEDMGSVAASPPRDGPAQHKSTQSAQLWIWIIQLAPKFAPQRYPGQLKALAAFAKADAAGVNGRPGLCTSSTLRLTSGSTSGRCKSPGKVTEYSGMNAKPMRAMTMD